jgi:hypothetical protein
MFNDPIMWGKKYFHRYKQKQGTAQAGTGTMAPISSV